MKASIDETNSKWSRKYAYKDRNKTTLLGKRKGLTIHKTRPVTTTTHHSSLPKSPTKSKREATTQ